MLEMTMSTELFRSLKGVKGGPKRLTICLLSCRLSDLATNSNIQVHDHICISFKQIKDQLASNIGRYSVQETSPSGPSPQQDHAALGT